MQLIKIKFDKPEHQNKIRFQHKIIMYLKTLKRT